MVGWCIYSCWFVGFLDLIGWVDVGLGWGIYIAKCWVACIVDIYPLLITWWFLDVFFFVNFDVFPTRYPAGMYTCLSGFVDMCEPVEEAFKREAFEEAKRTDERWRKWECFWMVKYIKIGATEQRLNGSYFSSHKSLHFLFLFTRLWGKRRKIELKPNLRDGVCFWCNTCSSVSSTSSLSWTQLDPASLVTSIYS